MSSRNGNARLRGTTPVSPTRRRACTNSSQRTWMPKLGHGSSSSSCLSSVSRRCSSASRYMVVTDDDLAELVHAQASHSAGSLKLKKSIGFSTDGLLLVAHSYRFHVWISTEFDRSHHEMIDIYLTMEQMLFLGSQMAGAVVVWFFITQPVVQTSRSSSSAMATLGRSSWDNKFIGTQALVAKASDRAPTT
ncbi:unnamed protein product [Urochloa humidicola]